MNRKTARKLAGAVVLSGLALLLADQAMAEQGTGNLGARINVPPTGPTSFGTASGGTSAAGHGLDAMDDLVLARCHKAGGGMVNYPEGYRCEDANGTEIDY